MQFLLHGVNYQHHSRHLYIFLGQIYAVGRNTSKLFLVDLNGNGGIRWESSFVDSEDGSTDSSGGNTEPMFAVGALDNAVFTARNGTDQVKTNASPQVVGEVCLLLVFRGR